MADLPKDLDKFDDTRRRFLVNVLSTAGLVGGLGWAAQASAQWFGKRPKKLPKDRSIFDMRGEVTVNGEPATKKTILTAQDEILVGSNSYVIAKVGGTAFMLRENTLMSMGGKGALVGAMRMVNGAMLAVFGERKSSDSVQVRAPTATIGIRGTGVYLEAKPDSTYLCTCYGTTDMAALSDEQQTDTVTATHHDAPRYILKNPENGKLIVPAPFLNHTDEELMTIEAIVGRQVPFIEAVDPYAGPRRDY